MRVNKKIIVFYHGNCPDGFGGAYAAWKHFGNKAEYVPLYRHAPVPEVRGKEIYMVDFLYNPEITKKLIKNNIRVTGIDHHISARESTELTKNYLYDTNHSGAVLSWTYFHKNKKAPMILRYVEDVDLWKFKIPHTREIDAVLDLLPFDFKAWDAFARKLESSEKRKKIIADGTLLLQYKNRLIENLILEAERVQFMNYRIYAVNSPVYASELGARLIKNLPPVAIIWTRSRGKVLVSLRSNGKVDVSKIAGKFGGGGHKAAAGFIIEKNQKIPWIPI